jgi:hypothetical protein
VSINRVGDGAYGETAALVVVAESIVDRPPVGGPAVRSGPSGWSVSGYEESRSLDVTRDDRQVTFLGAAGLTTLAVASRLRDRSGRGDIPPPLPVPAGHRTVNTLNVIEQEPNAGTVKNSWPQAQPHHRCQLLTGPGVNPLHDEGSVEPVRLYRLQS